MVAKAECPNQSVGLVQPERCAFEAPFTLASGRTLPNFDLMVETYGTLNKNKTNAVLICHALSGNHHAAGYYEGDKKPGWWEHYIGPGKAIDTNRFFVVSLNNLGGCDGSSGPRTINPETNEPWGATFPSLRVRDWVNSQYLLMQRLGILQWAAVIGGSLGGMQAMRWALEYPKALRHCIVIASAMKLTAQNIAFNETARQAILSDPDFENGHYLKHQKNPSKGLSVARMIGHITYLSDDGMGKKFGRDLRSGSFEIGSEEPVEFQIESYLRYQGTRFSENFDANTYILMTRALDYFDLAREYGHDACIAFQQALCKFLVISFTSDWRFAPERSQELVSALMRAEKNVSYAEIESAHGHDAFLVPEQPRYEALFKGYMEKIETEEGASRGE